MNTPRAALLALVTVAFAGLAPAARAQSLLVRPVQTPLDVAGNADPHAPLREVSLLFVEPPKPRTYKKNDIVTIIIDESSRQESKAKLDTSKDYTLSGGVDRFPDLLALLEGELRDNDDSGAGVGVRGGTEFQGDGTYSRTDSFRARIAATVLEVKPNGNLVLEARKTVQKDEETQTIVLIGTARTEDVTTSNTVLSSQLAELTLSSKSEGRVKEASEKGFIPRVFDALFAF